MVIFFEIRRISLRLSRYPPQVLGTTGQVHPPLEAVPEGDGTMLDNTLIVYLSDSPRVTIRFVKNGRLFSSATSEDGLGNRYLRYPWYGNQGHRTIANLYLSLLHAVGERKTLRTRLRLGRSGPNGAIGRNHERGASHLAHLDGLPVGIV